MPKAMKHPSAWELVEGENSNITYWKWRTRHMETLAILCAIAGFVLGGFAMALLIGALK
jgi:hypothetical protein